MKINTDAIISNLKSEITNFGKSFFQTPDKQTRIKHASQLLRTTDMAAKEVAYSCGFTDPKYFAKCFKSSTGQTPTEYRTQAEQRE